MSDRAVIVVLVVAAISAGCLGGTPSVAPTETAEGAVGTSMSTGTSVVETATDTTGSPSGPATAPSATSSLTPKALLERPANRTRAAVVSFVIEHAERRLYNEVIRDRNYTGVETNCWNRSTEERGEGYAVTITCDFSAAVSTDGERLVVNGARERITYVVNRTTVERHEA